jgi:dihydrofolate synthase/folylpolyglutamate synthase
LSARTPAAILHRLEQFGVRLGLETTRSLLAALGDPQRRLATVLVAGTNGKGSTAALLSAMAAAAGYRTALYTSPHLEAVEERLRVDGCAIAGERLAALLEAVLETAAAVLPQPPTYFEALTAAAVLHFAERQVDLAVLEVGMGGRLDATNATEPELSLITPISLDHREHLGATLAAVAGEKAGVLRPGRPAWSGGQPPEAAAALRRAAAACGARLAFADEAATVERAARGWDGQRLVVRAPRATHHLEIALLGAHQAENARLAVLAAETLADLGWRRLEVAAIRAGAVACRWPGRLESLLLPGGRRVLLDGAHNPDGIRAVTEFVDELGEPVDLLFGALADKPIAEMLPPLLSRAASAVLTTAPSPRAVPAAQLAAWAGGRAVLVEPDPSRALDLVLRGEAPLLVCGSLYLVGAARALLRQRFGVPPPAAAITVGPGPV